MPTRRIRGNNLYPLYSADFTQGWRIIRKVSYEAGNRNVLRGFWRNVTDQDGNHLGYLPLALKKQDAVVSNSSPTSVTAGDMRLYAGRAFPAGSSRTVGMHEDERLARRHPVTGAVLPPEDAVELVEAKVEAMLTPQSKMGPKKAAPYGDRAVRVYPRG